MVIHDPWWCVTPAASILVPIASRAHKDQAIQKGNCRVEHATCRFSKNPGHVHRACCFAVPHDLFYQRLPGTEVQSWIHHPDRNSYGAVLTSGRGRTLSSASVPASTQAALLGHQVSLLSVAYQFAHASGLSSCKSSMHHSKPAHGATCSCCNTGIQCMCVLTCKLFMHHAWCCADAGAGAIISSAAMKRASFQDVEDFALNIPPQSGDSLTHKIFWQVMDLAPTDPGMVCPPQHQNIAHSL